MEMLKILSSRQAQFSTDHEGPSIVAEAEALSGAVQVELFGTPGLISAPGAGHRMILLPVGGKAAGIAVSGHSYKLGLEILPGGTTIYATDASGATVLAKIELLPSGAINVTGDAAVNVTGSAINLNGSGRQLVTHAELDAALQGLVTAINAALATKQDAGGSPGTLNIDITAARADTLQTGP